MGGPEHRNRGGNSIRCIIGDAVPIPAGSSSRRALAVFVGLGLLGLIFFNAKARWVDVHYAKGEPLPAEIFSKWNSFSRIGVAPEKGSDRMQIIIDADAATGIARFDFDHLDAKMRTQLTHEGPGFVYTLRPGAKTLIIGPGGGWDVARALASGSKDITGVEINPIHCADRDEGEFSRAEQPAIFPARDQD